MSSLCQRCIEGMCCKDGVAVDLEEAKRISAFNIPLKRPWFHDLREDADFPSGWALDTTVRDGRCVFQRKDKKCRIYKGRPSSCRDFPYENNRLFKYLGYLCKEARNFRKGEPKEVS